MKKSLSLLVLLATIITSCKKDSNNKPATSGPVVLLKKIINNTSGDPDFGKTQGEFFYNGKQLSKAVFYSTSDVETDLFNYDIKGRLTGTNISHTNSNRNDFTSSTVTYVGENLAEIKFYTSGNVLYEANKFTYQNGKLTNWINDNQANTNYEYDNKGKNTKQVSAEYQNGAADGYVFTTTNSTFDDKSNLSQAIPFWLYFRVNLNIPIALNLIPGLNNPLTVNDSGTNFTYSYQYTSDGFPSMINVLNYSTQYEYIKVN